MTGLAEKPAQFPFLRASVRAPIVWRAPGKNFRFHPSPGMPRTGQSTSGRSPKPKATHEPLNRQDHRLCPFLIPAAELTPSITGATALPSPIPSIIRIIHLQHRWRVMRISRAKIHNLLPLELSCVRACALCFDRSEKTFFPS